MEIVSVIVPVYNIKIYTRHCLDSHFEHTYPLIDIIVISEALYDKSAPIANKIIVKVRN